MKTKFFVIILFFIEFSFCFSQDLSMEFGKISRDDLDYQLYEKDPNAEGVIIFDKGESLFIEVDNGFDIRFTRTKRIKILNRAGIGLAEVTIPYYVDGFGKTEKITSIVASSYNFENGQLIKKDLEDHSIFMENVNERWRAKKFTFPDVKEGTIIEYQYILETPFHFNLPDWEFQAKIPTLFSEYKVRMIPFYEYVFLAQGMTEFDSQISEPGMRRRYAGLDYKELVHTFTMTDVPAFGDEAFITSIDDYIMKMDFQLSKINNPDGSSREIITTWPELVRALLKHEDFGKHINRSKKFCEDILRDKPALRKVNEHQKTQSIIEYVKSTFNWNGYYSKFASKSTRDFINQKSGNAADINLFLVALLRAAGIEAEPVILSTRDYGKVRTDYPFEHSFNYVAVLVSDSKQLFLTDGTEPLVTYNRLPLRCINEEGLIVKSGEPSWVNLYSNLNSLNRRSIAMQINPASSTIDASVTIQATEFEALAYKVSFRDDSVRLRSYLLDNGLSNVDAIRTMNFVQTTRPYVITSAGKSNIEIIDNKTVISPFLNFAPSENPLKQKRRTYPVDFIYPKTESFVSILNLPENYTVLSLPDNYTADDNLVNINFTFSSADNNIEAKADYTLKKAVYLPDEYPALKQHFDNIIQKLNDQIVLENN